MNYKVVVLITFFTTIGFTVPGTAQIQNRSQDFFEQGWEQIEREIEILREKPLEEEANSQSPESEPLLDVKPSPVNQSGEPLDEEEIPTTESENTENLNSNQSQPKTSEAKNQ
ncbi:hypothetical protein H6F98_21305 [Microcoleus sp. FACHB-SPT15]|uniref:hypothetical protein n=1 Tax=Microcoleus sp. FACHB-SPT15 TaxID=2692830 RepID=UPI0017811F66|nr:hypothetical protein [Microcoleus sp. FACHB-SPT15]MBD1807970.1 hypothetical protein [Microcoleus sp. FACHB-SPT15]